MVVAHSSVYKWLAEWVNNGTPTVVWAQKTCGVRRTGPSNTALHAIFTLGAATGNELFFIVFLPWVFWEFDFQVGRRVIWLWASSYYVGQTLKDLLQLPRPPPVRAAGSSEAAKPVASPHSSSTSTTIASPSADEPSFENGTGVIRLESHYETEYGMPSTHAMNAVAMPGAVAFVTLSSDRFVGNHLYVLVGCFIWFVCCTLSRLYMGVHSPADIVTGLVLGAACLGTHVWYGHAIDYWILTSPHAMWALPVIVIVLVAVYPRPPPPVWVSTPGDTAVVITATAGIAMACNAFGEVHLARMEPGQMFGEMPMAQLQYMPLRTVIGFAVLVLTRSIVKAIATPLVTFVMGTPVAHDNPGTPFGGPPHGMPSSKDSSSTQADGFSSTIRRRNHVELLYEGHALSQDKTRQGDATGGSLRIRVPAGESREEFTSPRHSPLPSPVRAGTSGRYAVEIPIKMATYGILGWNALFLVPLLLQVLGLRQYGFQVPAWLDSASAAMFSLYQS